MASITTRAGKGAPLSWNEADANFTNLNTELAAHINDAIDAHVSSAISYLPAGTGAVATDVQSKLRESVSVKDFGAVGDGITDDTMAVQAAYNQAALGNGGILVLGDGRYKTTGAIGQNYIAPTVMASDKPAVLGLFDGSTSNPDTLNNDPVLWIQKITKRDGTSNVDHNPGGVLSEVVVLGSNSTGAVETSGTWISVLGNGVLNGVNVGTESVPDYDAGGNVIGVAGFARSSKPSNGIACGVWGYAQTPVMTDTEFDAWSNSFTTAACELNLDIKHKDPGAKSTVSGVGTTVGEYLMNYQESAAQRNWSFGIAFNSNPRTGFLYTDPDIANWHGFHTGILLDKIQSAGILFGQYFKNGSYGIRFPDTWLTQSPAASIHLGNTQMNLGQYLGTTFNNNDFWHNGGDLWFRYGGTNFSLLKFAGGVVNLATATNLQVASRTTLRLGMVANSVNNFTVFPAATGGAPAIVADGTDTNVDIELRPKGTGRVWVGAWTTNADTTINGYITVKDSTGALRKIATIA